MSFTQKGSGSGQGLRASADDKVTCGRTSSLWFLPQYPFNEVACRSLFVSPLIDIVPAARVTNMSCCHPRLLELS